MSVCRFPETKAFRAGQGNGDVSGASACAAPPLSSHMLGSSLPQGLCTSRLLYLVPLKFHPPPERLSRVPQVQAWYSIERLHRVCHYLPVCMYLVACCLSPLLDCQAPEGRDLCLFVYGCIPSLGQRLAHSRC